MVRFRFRFSDCGSMTGIRCPCGWSIESPGPGRPIATRGSSGVQPSTGGASGRQREAYSIGSHQCGDFCICSTDGVEVADLRIGSATGQPILLYQLEKAGRAPCRYARPRNIGRIAAPATPIRAIHGRAGLRAGVETG